MQHVVLLNVGCAPLAVFDATSEDVYNASARCGYTTWGLKSSNGLFFFSFFFLILGALVGVLLPVFDLFVCFCGVSHVCSQFASV